MTGKPTYEELQQRVRELEKAESELDRVKIAFRESEELYRKLIEFSPLPFLVTQDERIEFANPAAAKLFKTEHQNEIIGSSPKDWTHPDFAQQAYQRRCRAIETGRSLNPVELVLVTKENKKVVVLANATVISHRGSPALLSVFNDVTEQKQAERAMRESEEKFRTLIESINDWVWQVDPNGVYTYVSPQAEKIMKYQMPEILGKTPFDFMHQDEAKRVGRIFSEMKNRRASILGLEDTMFNKDGVEIIFETSATPLISKTGKLKGYIGTCRDITDRKHAEEALKNSEQKWRNILVNIPQIGIALDPDAKIIFANAHFLKVTGWNEEDIMGKDWFDTFIPAHAREDVRRVFAKTVDQKETFDISNYENEIMTKTGELRDVAWSNVPTKDLQGNITDVTCLGIDLTEIRQAEEELRKSNERLRMIAENTGTMIAILDNQGTYEFVNPAHRVLGYEPDELLGTSGFTLIHPEDVSKLAEALQKGLQGELSRFTVTYRAKHKDGRTLTIEGTFDSIWSKDGQLEKIVFVGDDITERKLMEEQLHQAQKMETVGRLAGGVAHDFNNMLGIIIANTEMAGMQCDADDPIYLNLQEILKASHRAADTARHLLAFARKQIVSPKVLDANDTILDSLKMLRRLIGEDIHLRFVPGKDVWKIKMDPSQLQQILNNLVLNSRDAMPNGGNITIETKNALLDEVHCQMHNGIKPGDYVMVAVSDTGEGIAPEVMDHLFDPFFTTKEVGKGTGLGLAMIYGAIKQNNGHVEIISELGEGATVRLYLPRVEEEASRPKEKVIEKTVPGGNETVLVAEDERALLDTCRYVLERQGYTVLTAQNPKEALEIAEKHPGEIDLLLTDVVMPDMDGKKLAEKLQAMRPSLKMLFMSGYTADVMAQHGILDQETIFIQKPFTFTGLAEKVREVLDKA